MNRHQSPAIGVDRFNYSNYYRVRPIRIGGYQLLAVATVRHPWLVIRPANRLLIGADCLSEIRVLTTGHLHESLTVIMGNLD